MTAILEITDGTQGNTIDLLEGENGGFGYSLVRWPQSIAQPKGGGVYEDSPLVEGRQLTLKVLSNAIEKLSLKCRGSSQDNLIGRQRELTRILDLAVQYWLGAKNISPFYIVSKSSTETITRYGVVVNYKIIEFPSTHEQPFIQPNCGSNAVFDNLDLAIERLNFLDNPPGQSEGVPISSAFSYDSRDLGVQTATSDEAVHIGNRHVEANLTHIYLHDISAATFSSNLMDASLPFTLMPSAVTNASLYFGIDDSVLVSPFGGLVFDFAAVASSVGVISTTEYWDGALWTALVSNGDALGIFSAGGVRPAGIYSFHWYHPNDWVVTTVNGVSAMWFRIRYSAPFGGSTITQRNRLIYTPSTPYLDISSTQIKGDKPALGRLDIRNIGGGSLLKLFSVTSGDGLVSDNIMVSSRSLNRGSDFSAYLNFSVLNNVTGVTGIVLPKTTIDFDSISPSGYRSTYNPTINTTNELAAQIEINGTGIPNQYIGNYTLSIRYIVEGVVVVGDTIKCRVEFAFGGTSGLVTAGFVPRPFYVSETIELTTSGTSVKSDDITIDTFEIPLTIPDIRISNEDVSTINVSVYVDVNFATLPDVYFYDVVIMPTDEVTNIQIRNTDTLKTLFVSEEFFRCTLSSLDDFRVPSKATVTISPDEDPNEPSVDLFQVIGNKLLVDHENDTRWWFLTRRISEPVKGSFNGSPSSICNVVQLFKNQQYLAAIGDE